MKKIICTVFIAMAMMACQGVMAQISHGGEPMFNRANTKSQTAIVQLPQLDNEKLLNTTTNNAKKGTPLRIGAGHLCEIDVLKEATLVEDARGRHYLLGVESPKATFVGLNFSTFILPDGAEIFFYDETGELVLGSFDKSDAMNDGQFYTQSIAGSIVFIEYNVPYGVEPGSLVINSVVHGTKEIFNIIDNIYDDAEASMKGPYGQAEGTCHPDVACPEGDDWRSQIRSVVAIQIIANTNYGPVPFMCSGALINNTRQDRTPYVLSAYHCQDQTGMLRDLREAYEDIVINSLSFTTYFLYQKNKCNGTLGSYNKSITGADIVAKYNYNIGSDMLLLRLKDTVPFDYKPYFAGWDRNEIDQPTAGACIHHPGGDYKKISIPKSIEASADYQKFYKVRWYTGSENKGVTEQGSSGSPLFNGDKRIVGQLYAGQSYCNQPWGTDLYGRVSVSWNGGNLSTNRLKTWLDPDNTGVTTLDGLDYSNEGISVVDNVKRLTVYPNPTCGIVRFDIDYLGRVDYKVFDLVGRCVKEGTTILTSTVQSIDLGTLPKGSYTLTMHAGSQTYSAQVVKR